jgi:hypothetical protein
MEKRLISETLMELKYETPTNVHVSYDVINSSTVRRSSASYSSKCGMDYCVHFSQFDFCHVFLMYQHKTWWAFACYVAL